MFITQFFNVKILSYVLFDIIVHFIIQKLKNKHTFLKTEKAKFSLRENLVFILFEEIVFFSLFFDKIHNYVLFAIIVHFNIQKLKNKQTFIQTEKAKSSHFDRTRGDKNQIFPTLNFLQNESSQTSQINISTFQHKNCLFFKLAKRSRI